MELRLGFWVQGPRSSKKEGAAFLGVPRIKNSSTLKCIRGIFRLWKTTSGGNLKVGGGGVNISNILARSFTFMGDMGAPLNQGNIFGCPHNKD